MKLRLRTGNFNETEENYRSAPSKIARFGIAASSIIGGLFSVGFGSFFGGLPLFMLIQILRADAGDSKAPTALIAAFISIFVFIGFCVAGGGILRIVKTILMIKNAPAVSAVPADMICSEENSPKPGMLDALKKAGTTIRDFRRGKIILPDSGLGSADAKITKKQRWMSAIFGGIFFAVGVGFCGFGVAKYIKNEHAAATWIEVPCEIISAEVETHRSSGGRRGGGKTTYSPEITFRYTYGGNAFTGNDVSLVSGFSEKNYQAAVRELRRLKTLKSCWIDPENPSESVLEKPLAGFSFRKSLVAVFGIPFALIGGGVMLFGIFSGRSRKKTQRESGEILPENKSAVGIVFGALFWNSLVAVFICAWLAQASHDWIFAAVLSPFVVVGIVLLVVAINALRKHLCVLRYAILLKPEGTLVAGTPVRVYWKIRRGDPEKIIRLSLNFLEMERDVDTQVNGEAVLKVVEKTTICESGSRSDFRSGACDFVPPEDHPTKRRFFAFELDVERKSALCRSLKLRFPVKLKDA